MTLDHGLAPEAATYHPLRGLLKRLNKIRARSGSGWLLGFLSGGLCPFPKGLRCAALHSGLPLFKPHGLVNFTFLILYSRLEFLFDVGVCVIVGIPSRRLRFGLLFGLSAAYGGGQRSQRQCGVVPAG